MPLTEPKSPYLPQASAAAFLHLSERTLEAFRSRGGGPPFMKVGARRVLYRVEDLRKWAEAGLRTSPEAA